MCTEYCDEFTTYGTLIIESIPHHKQWWQMQQAHLSLMIVPQAE